MSDTLMSDTYDEQEIAGLIRRVEQTTFPNGGAESDEQPGAPEA